MSWMFNYPLTSTGLHPNAYRIGLTQISQLLHKSACATQQAWDVGTTSHVCWEHNIILSLFFHCIRENASYIYNDCIIKPYACTHYNVIMLNIFRVNLHVVNVMDTQTIVLCAFLIKKWQRHHCVIQSYIQVTANPGFIIIKHFAKNIFQKTRSHLGKMMWGIHEVGIITMAVKINADISWLKCVCVYSFLVNIYKFTP